MLLLNGVSLVFQISQNYWSKLLTIYKLRILPLAFMMIGNVYYFTWLLSKRWNALLHARTWFIFSNQKSCAKIHEDRLVVRA